MNQLLTVESVILFSIVAVGVLLFFNKEMENGLLNFFCFCRIFIENCPEK